MHRDIKPANVLLVSSGDEGGRLRAKLADFGVAKLLGGEHPDEGALTIGTAAYLSPEQVGNEHVGPESDVYQLGLVLLEALTGHVEYPGSAETSAFARLDRDPEVPATTPLPLGETIRGMVARDPSTRLSPEAVIVSLRRFSLGADAPQQATDERSESSARRYDLFDTPPDDAFRGVASFAARLGHAPIAIIRIVDERREAVRMPSDDAPAAVSIGYSTSVAVSRAALELTGSGMDARVLADPLVAAQLGLQYFFAVPLTTADGHPFGTLCVLDYEARTATADERRNLEELAATVVHEMELRRAVRRAVLSAD